MILMWTNSQNFAKSLWCSCMHYIKYIRFWWVSSIVDGIDHQYTIGQSGIQLAHTKIYIQKITKQQIGAIQVNIEAWTEVDEF